MSSCKTLTTSPTNAANPTKPRKYASSRITAVLAQTDWLTNWPRISERSDHPGERRGWKCDTIMFLSDVFHYRPAQTHTHAPIYPSINKGCAFLSIKPSEVNAFFSDYNATDCLCGKRALCSKAHAALHREAWELIGTFAPRECHGTLSYRATTHNRPWRGSVLNAFFRITEPFISGMLINKTLEFQKCSDCVRSLSDLVKIVLQLLTPTRRKCPGFIFF